jgi:hypothetical protein
MRRLTRNPRLSLWLMVSACLAPLLGASDEPATVLRHYINLRLANADRSAYSSLITWSDEPTAACEWVTSHFKLQTARQDAGDVVIPVTYDRLGRYCSDLNLELFEQSEQVDYHLVMSAGGWKVAGPVPDYPDIEIQTLLRSLANSAQTESPERRRQIDEVIRQLRVALRKHPAIATRP